METSILQSKDSQLYKTIRVNAFLAFISMPLLLSSARFLPRSHNRKSFSLTAKNYAIFQYSDRLSIFLFRFFVRKHPLSSLVHRDLNIFLKGLSLKSTIKRLAHFTRLTSKRPLSIFWNTDRQSTLKTM